MIEQLIHEGIFVVHALRGYESHERRIVELFRKNKLNFEFVIAEEDPNLFRKEIMDKYFIEDINTILSKGTLLCTLSHIYAYERIVRKNIRYAIVFEDDPCFLGNFVATLKKYSSEIENLPTGFIISLENSSLRFPSYWQTKNGKFLYDAKSGRMAGAYIIDLVGAQNILKELERNKCDAVIDWWHNSLIDRGVIKMYWAHPPLVEQGSLNGVMHSTMSSRPDGVIRRISWLLQKFYKYYIRRLFKEENIF